MVKAKAYYAGEPQYPRTFLGCMVHRDRFNRYIWTDTGKICFVTRVTNPKRGDVAQTDFSRRMYKILGGLLP
jgi:hypothetical protein